MEIIKEIKEDKKIFLKIDIEGQELNQLKQLLKYQEKFKYFLIHFHNIQKNNLSIINFIKKINLEIDFENKIILAKSRRILSTRY